MVVLAGAVLTKNGKTLLSRQFVELSRPRIEGLLSAFPKLLGSEKQHTFVETDAVRYLYHPLEGLYVLLVTNKTSNILEDLETLHLLAKIVPEYSHNLDEKEIAKNAFDIVFAFDEAVAMGYKERVTLQQVKHFTSMVSHDEERFKQDEKNKIIRAKREADRQRKLLEKKRLEEKRSGMTGMGGGGFEDRHSSYTPTISRQPEPVIEKKQVDSPKTEQRGKGMQLGKKKETVYSKVLKEENVPEPIEAPTSSGAPSSSLPAQHGTVHVAVAETIALTAQNDGGIENLEIKGELIVSVFDPAFSKIQVHLSQGENKPFQFKTHPNINKTLYSDENILALRDQRAYPIGAPSSVLKWRLQTTDEKYMPLSINCWPSVSGKEITIPIEYEKTCNFDLLDVVISVPIPGGSPVVGEVVGSTDFDAKKGLLYWKIPIIDQTNSQGRIEFTVPNAPKAAFFPISVNFRSTSTFCLIQAVTVSVEGNEGKTTDFTQETSLTVEQYDIE